MGVFAGILVPEDRLSQYLPPFQALITKYMPPTGKLHIADLPNEQKEALRQDAFKAIRSSQLPCFWYAIHVAGFHAHHQAMEEVDEAARAAAAASTVKRGSPRSEPESLHEALFMGLYGHLIAFLAERERGEVEIEVRSDQIDAPIIKEFKKAAVRLLDTGPTTTRVTGFDTVSQTIVGRQITSQICRSPELEIDVEVKNLKFNPIAAGDGLVLAADILANSLNYLFKNRSHAERYGRLNTPEAVASHPLAQNLDAFMNWGGGDLMGDALYRHPRREDPQIPE